MNTYGIIMAGGGGTRFWPLSRHTRPKQLLNLSGRDLMINDTIDRILPLCDKNDIYVVTHKDQAPQTVEATSSRILPEHILAEPAARNTAACIGYAAMEVLKKRGDGILCVFPSDHFIENEAAFRDAVRTAAAAAEAEDCLVTIGIEPTFPCTGYGYIRFDRGEAAEARKVLSFQEKPDLATAQAYLSSGQYAWNSGMFVWKASVILERIRTLLPKIYEPLAKIGEAMGTEREAAVIAEVYPTIPSISVDYGILEKSDNVRVVSADMGWNDVGTWDSFDSVHTADVRGNIHIGESAAVDTENTITYSQERLIATLGVKNLIVVETPDAVLVCDKSRAQDVRQIVDLLKEQKREDLL